MDRKGQAHSWLTSYLSAAGSESMLTGTLQPGITYQQVSCKALFLGLLLFLLYTINLPYVSTNTNTTCSQFADDTTLTSSSSFQQTHHQLQHSVTAAATWLRDWHLLVNAQKTVVMVFYHDKGPPTHHPAIYLNNILLSRPEALPSWCCLSTQPQLDPHINYTLTKAMKCLHTLLKIHNPLHSSALVTLYCTHVRSILEYACIAMTLLPTTLLDKLERFQGKAVRICLHHPLYGALNHPILLHRTKLLTIFSHRKIKLLLLSHSIFHHNDMRYAITMRFHCVPCINHAKPCKATILQLTNVSYFT